MTVPCAARGTSGTPIPRVMRVITRMTVSGPSTHVVLANQGLAARGWKTLLVHGATEAGESQFDLKGVDLPVASIQSLRRSLGPHDAQAFLALLGTMRRFRPTVVHTHHSKAGLLGRLAAAIAGVPVRVHTYHGTVFEGYFSPRVSSAIVSAERGLALITTQLVVLSDRQRAQLVAARVARPDRIAVVPLGVELERFGVEGRLESRTRLGIDPRAYVLVAVGRFAPIKRFDRLLRAFAIVRQSIPNAHLFVLGDGTARPELERLAISLDIGNSAHFVGWSDALPSWYAASDVVVNTSDNEGTPLTLIEAAASARAAVATRVGGVPDVVIDGTTGLLADRDDVDGLAACLVRLGRDRAERDRLGSAARIAAESYSKERLCDTLDALYRDLIGGRRRGAASNPPSRVDP